MLWQWAKEMLGVTLQPKNLFYMNTISGSANIENTNRLVENDWAVFLYPFLRATSHIGRR
jgi:hypothetical protein